MSSVPRYFEIISFRIVPSHNRTSKHLTSVTSASYCRTDSNLTPQIKGIHARVWTKDQMSHLFLSLSPGTSKSVTLPDTHCLNRRMNESLKSGNVTRQLVEGEARWWGGKFWALGRVGSFPDTLESPCLHWGFSMLLSPSRKGPARISANVTNIDSGEGFKGGGRLKG